MSSIRALFPFFNKSNEVYLDTAATSQRLGASLLAMSSYYETFNANVHRGTYISAVKASNEYENARQSVANFIGAHSASEIVFTSGATDAINLIANGLDINDLQGKYILLCESEHHANLLPWQAFAAKHSLALKKISLGENGVFTKLELTETLNNLDDDVAILAIAHVSNVLGNIFPVEELCNKAALVNALSVIDGTQAAAHLSIDVKTINCDFYCLSGHKMYAGTGIGVLYGKMQCLDKLKPSKLGGEMITHVTWESYQSQPPPTRFEAGTPNIAGALSLPSAVNFIKQNLPKIQVEERALTHYVITQLKPLVDSGELILLGNVSENGNDSIAIVSFYVPSMHANDVAMFLATQQIAVRAGHHCAMPLMQSLNIDGCVRLSMACYTSKEDIDSFITAIFAMLKHNVDRPIMIEHCITSERSQKQSASIESALLNTRDWNGKHRILLLQSKQLEVLHEDKRLPEHEVAGCEARVWVALNEDTLVAYSNSKVVRGILSVIVNKINALSKEDRKNFDINAYLDFLGLSHYFSQGRRDGIQQVIGRINLLFAKT